MDSKKTTKKKVLGVLLALLLIISQIAPIRVYADPIPTDAVFTVGSASAMEGETFSVPVSIKDCPLFWGGSFEVLFDNNVFELENISLHEDRNPQSGYSFMPNVDEGLLQINGDGGVDFSFENCSILWLTFKVKDDVVTKDYFINMRVNEDDEWINTGYEQLAGTFVAGTISVTGIDGEAEYNGEPYSTIQEALAEAALDPDPGTATVKVLKNVLIDKDDDRLIIPDGADIKLDLNGKTITADFADGHLIEVNESGKLKLTSTAEDRGKFTYSSRPTYSDDTPAGLSFLLNEGTLDMSSIEVTGFWQGVVDGKYPDFITCDDPFWPDGAGGTLGILENCAFDTVFTAIGLGQSNVETIHNCQITADAHPVGFGHDGLGSLSNDSATVAMIDKTTILSRRVSEADYFGSLNVGFNYTVNEIKDSTITDAEGASGSDNSAALVVEGTVLKITSTSGSAFTRIAAPALAIDLNGGIIGLIESDHTRIESAGTALSNDLGTLSQVTGGVFAGGTDALVGHGDFSNIKGGYYKANEGVTVLSEAAETGIPTTDGYGLSSQPLKSGPYEGYYHIGPAVTITWKVGDEDDQEHIFIEGDPVYYAGEVEEPDGQYFTGWMDQNNDFYGKTQPLPPAASAMTYTAKFGDKMNPEDYKVIVVSDTTDANAGEAFDVDVRVTSEGNDSFFGATVEVLFDHTELDYDSYKPVPGEDENGGFTVIKKGEGKLLVVGAYLKEDGTGFEIGNEGFTLTTLTFKAKLSVETGDTAEIGIGDEPIVDQKEAIESQPVTKGGPLTVKLWNLKVTFKAGENVNLTETYAYVKYKEAGLYTAPGYGTPFTEPTPMVDTHYKLDDPLWKSAGEDVNISFTTIQGMAFEGDATFTATASPKAFELHYSTDYVTPESGVETDNVITYQTDVTFKAKTPKYAYKVKTVTYKVGENGTEETLTAEGDLYTIPGTMITDHVWITVTDEMTDDPEDPAIEIVLTKNDFYRGLPEGYQLVEVRIPKGALPADQAFAIDGDLIFYSPLYSKQDNMNTEGKDVYVYAVSSGFEVEGVLAILTVVSGANEVLDDPANPTFGGKFDVNEDGRVNSTDVVLTYGFYKSVHLYKGINDSPSLRMRLRADINGDRAVDTTDAQMILDHIWGP